MVNNLLHMSVDLLFNGVLVVAFQIIYFMLLGDDPSDFDFDYDGQAFDELPPQSLQTLVFSPVVSRGALIFTLRWGGSKTSDNGNCAGSAMTKLGNPFSCLAGAGGFPKQETRRWRKKTLRSSLGEWRWGESLVILS